MILGVTGHRPSSMPGVSDRSDLKALDDRLCAFAERCIYEFPRGLPHDGVISGMAEGWDLACAEAAIRLGLPLVAAVPFEGQERYWGPRAQTRYRALLARALRVEIVGARPGKAAYLKRDEWIVDHADAMLGLCGKATGGSAYTMDYARRWCVPSYNVWSQWVLLNQ